ncbi:hypothetical protein MJO29_013041 [Puccinia striiformis f. sp. tritici]|nr:hypothetical protein MJO29_013041 [Puccinia striiformis f. sp. tritici]
MLSIWGRCLLRPQPYKPFTLKAPVSALYSSHPPTSTRATLPKNSRPVEKMDQAAIESIQEILQNLAPEHRQLLRALLERMEAAYLKLINNPSKGGRTEVLFP